VLHTCRQPSSIALRDIQHAVFAEPGALAELCDFDSVFSIKTLNVVAKLGFLPAYAVRCFLAVDRCWTWSSRGSFSIARRPVVFGALLIWACRWSLLRQIRRLPLKAARWRSFRSNIFPFWKLLSLFLLDLEEVYRDISLPRTSSTQMQEHQYRQAIDTSSVVFEWLIIVRRLILSEVFLNRCLRWYDSDCTGVVGGKIYRTPSWLHSCLNKCQYVSRTEAKSYGSHYKPNQ